MTYCEIVESSKDNQEARERVKKRLCERLIEINDGQKENVEAYDVLDVVESVEELLGQDDHYLFPDTKELINDIFQYFNIS